MKTIRPILLAIIVIASTLYASAQTEKGNLINPATAQKWAKQFNTVHSKDGSFVNSTLSGELFSVAYMKEILSSNDVMGLYIYKSSDFSNREKLLLYKANAEERIIDRAFTDLGCPKPPGCDQMIAKYQAAHPAAMKAQLFNKKAFNDILSNTSSRGVFIMNAIDDQNREKFVLAGVDSNGEIIWTTAISNGKTCSSEYSESADIASAKIEKGSLINVTSAQRWTDRYNNTVYSKEANFVNSTLSGELFSINHLKDILASNDVEGLYIYKSMLDNKEKLLLYRANVTGSIIDRAFTDVGCPIPPNCKDMIEKYQTEHPGALKAQLFERKAFNSILANTSIKGVFIMNALDDQNQEKFVLAGVDSKGEIIWNTAVSNGMTCSSDNTEEIYISKASK